MLISILIVLLFGFLSVASVVYISPNSSQVDEEKNLISVKHDGVIVNREENLKPTTELKSKDLVLIKGMDKVVEVREIWEGIPVLNVDEDQVMLAEDKAWDGKVYYHRRPFSQKKKILDLEYGEKFRFQSEAIIGSENLTNEDLVILDHQDNQIRFTYYFDVTKGLCTKWFYLVMEENKNLEVLV